MDVDAAAVGVEERDLLGRDVANADRDDLELGRVEAAADGGMVSMSHILHGTRRELQKMGRLVSEGDMILE